MSRRAAVPELVELPTPAEVAALRKCTERKLRAERTDKTGIPFVLDGRSPRYRRDDVARFLASLPTVATCA